MLQIEHGTFTPLVFSIYGIISAINLICFLWSQTWLLHFSIPCQLLVKPLLYAQAFVFKTFHIFSLVSTSLSHQFAKLQ